MSATEQLFIDPEDIEFAPKRKSRPIYAVVWTWRKHRICKTKKRAVEVQRVWKRWYERNGWKVTSHGGGYFAMKDNVRHSIVLHEYDATTKERLK